MANLDPTFTINNYNEPKILTNKETYINNILMILFGKPGFYPSIPTLGMNIEQYLYKFDDDINTESIKSELSRQCSDFFDDINSGDFDIVKTVYKEKIFLIFKLPNIDDIEDKDVAIGVTTNTKGEIIFNFVETNKTQIL